MNAAITVNCVTSERKRKNEVFWFSDEEDEGLDSL